MPLLEGSTDQGRDFVISEGGFLKSEEPIIEYATFFPYNLKASIQQAYRSGCPGDCVARQKLHVCL